MPSTSRHPSSRNTGRIFRIDSLERRWLLSAPLAQTYLTNFTKNGNLYTNLNEEYPHTGTGTPGNTVGTPNASFLFDPSPSAVMAAGYAPDYISGSNVVNNGIDFSLTSDSAGHDFDAIDGGATTTVTANLKNVQTVYALMGAYYGQSFNATFTGADGTTQVFNSVFVPDFNGGSINTSGTNYTDQTVFQVRDVGAGGTGNSITGAYNNYDLTEVAFTLLPSLSDQELTSISFESNGTETLLMAVTATRVSPPVRYIGGLDPDFGTNGLASHDVAFTSTNGVAQDGSQSVIIGTTGTAPTESFGVTRYDSDGSLDSTFGSAGVANAAFGSTDDVPAAVDVLTGGTILVAGTATSYTSSVASGSEFAVAEFNPDGSLNTGFGGGTGEALIGFSAVTGTLSNDTLNAMTVGTGGTIYLGGSSGSDFAIAALNPDGSVAAFGSGGKATLSFGAGDDVINSLAAQSNGDIVAAGSAVVGGATEIALARFLPGGSLDKHFGTQGLVMTDVRGVYDSASSVAIEPRGQITIGGVSVTGAGASISSDFVVARYTAAGRIDRSFGGGPVITSFGEPSAVTQLVLESNGEIVASGKATANLSSVIPDELDVAVARYTIRGALDTTFDTTGKTIVDLALGVVAAASQSSVFSDRMIQPLAASGLGSAFDSFVDSNQGTATATPGGEILNAGNSGTATVEAEFITAGVDLAVNLLSSVPTAVTGGAKGTATVDIQETGTSVASGIVTIELDIASDAQGDSDTPLKSLPEHINLRQQQARTYRIAFLYPQSVTAGSYYLIADVVNGASPTLMDLNTQNNVMASTTAVDIAPPFVSLVGSALSTASTFTEKKSAVVSFTMTNEGNEIARGATTVDLILSADQTASDGTTVDPAKVAVGLPADKSRVYRVSFKLPTTVVAGTYYLIAVIDPADSLGTIDQSNSVVVDPTPVIVG